MVVLTGAGISTGSGIPDFRSPGGIWEKFRIIDYSEFITSEAARLEDWRRRFFMEDQLGKVKPNIGHEMVANWVKAGKCSTLVTQNIDGLHFDAGTPEDVTIEIHGNARYAYCIDCDLRHEIAECRQQLETDGTSPKCFDCGGIVKSAVVMFGQAMPERQTKTAFEAAQACDLFIAMGTSLLVNPAASLPQIARDNGAKLVIINRETTPLDPIADLVIHEEIGEVMTKLKTSGEQA